MTCPAGLWFNNNSKQCDYRQNVECERNTVTTTTPSISISTNTPSTELSTISSDSTETTSTDDITEESTGSSTGQSTVPTNICSGLSDGSLLPFTQNCFQYIECQSENIVLCKCPNDLLFDPKLLICSDPETVQCLSEDPTTTETTISSSTPDTSSICQDKELGSTMPYVEDCQWYYYCWGDGSFSLFPCPLYNWYNPHTGSCGYGSPTICQESTTTSQTISTTTTIQSTTTDEGEQNQCEDQQFGVTFPLPTNCQQYILCMGDGQSAVVNCIYYSWYDPLTGECGQNVSPTACSITPTTTAAPEITTTLSPDQICKNQLLGKTYPLPSNCEKYILCMGNGMSAIANCIYNSWYDPKTGEWYGKYDANGANAALHCSAGSTGAKPDSITPPTLPGINGMPAVGIMAGENGFHGKGAISQPAYQTPARFPNLQPIQHTKCATSIYQHNSNSPVVFAYPGDCKKYYSCLNGLAYTLECPDGFYWHEAELRCEHQNLVDCTNSAVVSVSDIGHAAYPGDCNLYYEIRTWNCPPGFHWNAQEQSCDSGLEGNCQTYEYTQNATPPTVDAGIDLESLCAGNQGQFLPYPNDCRHFIQCDYIPFVKTCPQYLYWNSRLLTCDKICV
ncbi:uncharacterized protein LOC115622275 [Scaptodrosophila lebanonensis]|uniref:Uncharacterized protein LOC115622275 n=1 Tax=Drosophila lebanonensis TaxID=7225 RepID=A0A6J2T525_DROLE|nr:uncharacterized protein LOC115622275 [Scaptodrosophila lebanonensis]